MAQKAQIKTLTSNGNTKGVHSRCRMRNWFFTLNNYTEEDVKEILNSGYLKISMQEEKGEKDGTKHLQGVLVFEYPKDFNGLKKWCNGRIHWEICRNIYAARKYCNKEKTCNGRKWSEGWNPGIKGKYKVKDVLEDEKKCHKWQKEIIDIVKGKVDERKVYWYWDIKGNIGKSALAKHLGLCYDGIKLDGARKDCFYSLMKNLEEGIIPKVCIFDLPRCDENNVNYHVIEDIKNGWIFSGKYESCQVFLPEMHVIVFANFEPNKEFLSEDRWVVKYLGTKKNI